MKQLEVYGLVLIIGILIGGMLTTYLMKPQTEYINLGPTRWMKPLRDFNVPKFPYMILIPEEGAVDTFIAYEDTPCSEYPIQTKQGIFPIPITYDGTRITDWYGEMFVRFQGIGDSMWVEIPHRAIKLHKSKVKPLRFYGYGAISLNIQKMVLSEMELGATFFSRFTAFGRIEPKQIEDIEGKKNWIIDKRVGLKIGFNL
jgi:hypothetical protein